MRRSFGTMPQYGISRSGAFTNLAHGDYERAKRMLRKGEKLAGWRCRLILECGSPLAIDSWIHLRLWLEGAAVSFLARCVQQDRGGEIMLDGSRQPREPISVSAFKGTGYRLLCNGRPSNGDTVGTTRGERSNG